MLIKMYVKLGLCETQVEKCKFLLRAITLKILNKSLCNPPLLEVHATQHKNGRSHERTRANLNATQTSLEWGHKNTHQNQIQ
jgi:hypothetical protein